MKKYIAFIIVIILVIWIRCSNNERMYGDWRTRANYPIGSYDPSLAPISIENRP